MTRLFKKNPKSTVYRIRLLLLEKSNNLKHFTLQFPNYPNHRQQTA